MHVPRSEGMKPSLQALLRKNPLWREYEALGQDPDAFLAYLDTQGVHQAWCITYNAAPTMGYGRESGEWIAEFVQANPQRLVAVAGYHPDTDGDGAAMVDAWRESGVSALKIHPVHQHISPGDERLWSFYGRAEELRMPVVFHTGTSNFPGADNSFAGPGPLAHVLEAFPELPVIVAHGGRPHHTKEALDLLRFDNAWIDFSGCPPSRLRDYFGDLDAVAPRTLWGTDWPGPKVPDMKTNLDAFRMLGLTSGSQELILHDNAARLLASVV